MRACLALFLGVSLSILAGCTTPIMLPPSGMWDATTVALGPVVACKGGASSGTVEEGCGGWPLSLPSMPHPDVHYAELKARAAQQYTVDQSVVVLKDVHVDYRSEINGVIRGWRATAIAGRTP